MKRSATPLTPAERKLSLPDPGPADRVLLIMKLPGEQCNIDCLYCFEKRKPSRSSKRVDAAAVHRVLSALGPRDVRVVLQGGEPLLIGKNRMRSVLQALAEYRNVVSLSIMTNATLLDPDWIELFETTSHRPVEWGVSFDGGAELSNFRVTYRNEATVGDTLTGMELLHQHHKRFGVISVINSLHVGHAKEFVQSIAKVAGVRSVKLVPCFDYGVSIRSSSSASGYHQRSLWNADNPTWSIDPMDFARFVSAVTAHWIHAGLWRKFELEPTMSISRNLLGLSSDYTDYSLFKDSFVLTMYPDGTVTGHDRAQVTIDQDGLPAVHDASVEDLLRREVAEQKSAWEPLLERCSRCSYWGACHGSELFTRLAVRRGGAEDRFCESRAHMIDNVRPYLPSPTLNRPAPSEHEEGVRHVSNA